MSPDYTNRPGGSSPCLGTVVGTSPHIGEGVRVPRQEMLGFVDCWYRPLARVREAESNMR